MRTFIHHGEFVGCAGTGIDLYLCARKKIDCHQGVGKEHAECFVPLPAAAEDSEVKAPVGSWTCSCGYAMSLDRCRCAKCGASAPPLLEAPEQEKVPDSTPVTFAAILAYHRQRAADPRADRAWHEEAVECLRGLAGYLGEVCRPCTGEYDGEVCQYDRCLIWRARKAVEGGE